jgi:uncharacterized protein with GYD domain
MATYIVLINFTEQGIRNIKDSPKRAAAATEPARGCGIEIRDIFRTLGAFDRAVLIEAPDDQAVTSWALKVGSLGNVRTRTLRAFRTNEFENLVAKLKGRWGCSQRGGVDRFEIGSGDPPRIKLRGPLSGGFFGEFGQPGRRNVQRRQ